jgi:hypothetical protein
MAELEEILENDWRELVAALEEAVEAAPSPVALPAARRMPLSPVALFAQLEEVREEWRELRSAMTPGDAGRYVNAAWTFKDLVAHVASWAKEFRHEVETVVGGGSFDYAIPYVMTVMGPNVWNEEQVREREAHSLDASFDELDSETDRLQELLFEMSEKDLYAPATFPLAPSGDPAAKWKGPSAVIIAAKCEHDRHHIGQLRKRLQSWR